MPIGGSKAQVVAHRFPGNLLIDGAGTVRIADLGVACLAQANAAAGTIGYELLTRDAVEGLRASGAVCTGNALSRCWLPLVRLTHAHRDARTVRNVEIEGGGGP